MALLVLPPLLRKFDVSLMQQKWQQTAVKYEPSCGVTPYLGVKSFSCFKGGVTPVLHNLRSITPNKYYPFFKVSHYLHNPPSSYQQITLSSFKRDPFMISMKLVIPLHSL